MGGIFIDIGANLGLYSLLAERLGAQTILFEPEPRHFTFLKRNHERFGAVHQIALSDQSGSATLRIGDLQHSGASSLSSGPSDIYGDAVEVQTRTFDAFLETRGAEPSQIRLIKIDVEGHEAAVIRGMAHYLSQSHSAPIWCEVRGPQSNRAANSYREVIDFMHGYGYRPFIAREGRTRPFDEESDVRQVFDLLMLNPSRHVHRAMIG